MGTLGLGVEKASKVLAVPWFLNRRAVPTCAGGPHNPPVCRPACLLLSLGPLLLGLSFQ